MIYTHVLNRVGREAFAVRWMGCDPCQDGCYFDPNKNP